MPMLRADCVPAQWLFALRKSMTIASRLPGACFQNSCPPPTRVRLRHRRSMVPRNSVLVGCAYQPHGAVSALGYVAISVQAVAQCPRYDMSERASKLSGWTVMLRFTCSVCRRIVQFGTSRSLCYSRRGRARTATFLLIWHTEAQAVTPVSGAQVAGRGTSMRAGKSCLVRALLASRLRSWPPWTFCAVGI